MMRIIEKAELSKQVQAYRELNYRIGFVPTMGALHFGHLSLVRKSRAENQISIVSIFVNPTQFNDSKDLEKYPRTPEQDLEMLDAEGVDIVFVPDVETIYPDEKRNVFDLDGLDKPMEGKFREGHFDGVADVVYRLFDIVKPDRAYFGEKDYQQLKIIQQMTNVAKLPVEICSGEIVRESDGLAMSSRNMRLSEQERSVAVNIYRIMRDFDPKAFVENPSKAEKMLAEEINQYEHLQTEYVSIVEDDSMQTPENLESDVTYRLCIAVWCGQVRLIDNLTFVISNNY
ncbi:MAG: pantoate--beta-alanine ligase [Bacteroidales bacterium]|jgi:pantoate--beta-alanine ligase|nr:pantoate--beta-alanine ligase [Bacteroidales bacterium]